MTTTAHLAWFIFMAVATFAILVSAHWPPQICCRDHTDAGKTLRVQPVATHGAKRRRLKFLRVCTRRGDAGHRTSNRALLDVEVGMTVPRPESRTPRHRPWTRGDDVTWTFPVWSGA